MGKLKAVHCVILLAVVPWLASSCAARVKTTVRRDSQLARIGSYGVLEVAEFRGSDIVARALVPDLRQKGFVVEKGSVRDADEISRMGSELGVNGVIYGYILGIDQRSWVTEGEEDIRVREMSKGWKARVRYDPPTRVTQKTISVRLRAHESDGGEVLWEVEGSISDDIGADSVFLVEKLVGRMLSQLSPPSAESLQAAELRPQPSGLVGEKAPGFTAETIDGGRVTLSDFEGRKIVVLNFWGVRCLPCIQEMPKLEDIYNRYKNRGLEILAVNVDGVGAEIIKKSLRRRVGGFELNVTYPLLLDTEFKIIDAYHLTVAPLTVLIDRNGIVRYRHTDYQEGDEVELEAAIKQVMQ